MTPSQVSMAMDQYGKMIPKGMTDSLQTYLGEASDECFDTLMSIPGMKGQKKTLLLSIFLGLFGVDRFYLDENRMGMFKLGLNILWPVLLLVGMQVLGILFAIASLIWYGIDIYFTCQTTKQMNYERLRAFLERNREKEPATPAE